MIVTEPNLQVILFIMPFMFSPFYILADYQLKKYEKLGNLKGFFRWVYGFILAYTPIIGFTLLLTGGIVQSLSLLSYLSGIMSPLGFILLAYPFISYAVLDKTILKT
jgi:TRAP-type mannitol/chloroaromatic compound transport system permease small subunit